jgi:hypothetical protein
LVPVETNLAYGFENLLDDGIAAFALFFEFVRLVGGLGRNYLRFTNIRKEGPVRRRGPEGGN